MRVSVTINKSRKRLASNAEQNGKAIETYGRYCGGSGGEGFGLPVPTEQPSVSRDKPSSAPGSTICGGADGRGSTSPSDGALGKMGFSASKGGADGWGSGS